MTNLKEKSKEAFIGGVKNAVSELEKNASFNEWMTNNARFRTIYSEKIASLVTKVRKGSTTL